MTKQEVIQILAICKEVGVQFANSDNNILIKIWQKSFEKNSYEEVSQALFELINSKKGLFLNGLIGEIKAQIISNKVEFLDFNSVWEILRKAMHRTHPDIPQETIAAFNSLPPMLQHLVISPEHLEEMEYCLDRNILETVEKAHMQKRYAEMVIESKNQMLLGKEPIWQKRIASKQEDKLQKKIGGMVNTLVKAKSLDKKD